MEAALQRRQFEHKPKFSNGYSLVEATVVLLLLLVVAGFVLPGFNTIRRRMSGDAAMNQTVAQLRRGRELAIAQRRNIEIRFADACRIELVRHEITNDTTILSTVTLDDGVEFRLFDGLPDTPDLFGQGAAVDFGENTMLVFLSDGTLVNEDGNPVNGSVFMGLADRPETARAVTIIGATGRIRGYRWTGKDWVH
jgi:type II secretory pathway pseudopilin PulG